MHLEDPKQPAGATHEEAEARGETFYPGPSRSHLAAYPPKERWDNWTELDSQAWPRRKERHYSLVPTTCFNCESACGLLAYIDKVTGEFRRTILFYSKRLKDVETFLRLLSNAMFR